MDNFTQEEIVAIKKFLSAQIALDKHLEKAKDGYKARFVEDVDASVENLKKIFPVEEVDFIISAAYRPELIKAFV